MGELRTVSPGPSATPRTDAVDARPNGGWMPSVPAETRGLIRSGMRWTVWLTALAVPFSYGTKILLARTSPETLGVYGLLLVYVTVVSSVFYLGGDAVAIKFLPELAPEKRSSFLFSYFLVICASMVAWLGLAMLFPEALRYIFGRDVSEHFLLLVLCLAPLPALFSLIQASLKANLDFRRAQFLARTVTIGSFVAYGFLFLFGRDWLLLHPSGIIWSVYLALVLTGIAVGLRWLRHSPFLGSRTARQVASVNSTAGRQSAGILGADGQDAPRICLSSPLSTNFADSAPEGRLLRFFLPRGFWSYALWAQSASLVTLLQRVDFVLVLNFGGMRDLGEYVAITTLALALPTVSRFFLDTLLPSLTNLLALHEHQAAGEVFRAHMRLLLLIIAIGTCALTFLASPLIAIFGTAYRSLALPVLVLAALVGMASPGLTGGILLLAIGKPHRGAWISPFQVAVNAGLFFLLWPHFHLLGAVLALGISQLAGAVLVFTIAARSVPFRAGTLRGWLQLAFVLVAAAAVAWQWNLRSWHAGLVACSLSVLLYLLIGRYRLADCHELWQWVVPNPGGLWRKGRDSLVGLGER